MHLHAKSNDENDFTVCTSGYGKQCKEYCLGIASVLGLESSEKQKSHTKPCPSSWMETTDAEKLNCYLPGSMNEVSKHMSHILPVLCINWTCRLVVVYTHKKSHAVLLIQIECLQDL